MSGSDEIVTYQIAGHKTFESQYPCNIQSLGFKVVQVQRHNLKKTLLQGRLTKNFFCFLAGNPAQRCRLSFLDQNF